MTFADGSTTFDSFSMASGFSIDSTSGRLDPTNTSSTTDPLWETEMSTLLSDGGAVVPGPLGDIPKWKVFAHNDFYIGLGLAITASMFIGSSFIIKKTALLKAGRAGRIRAGLGGHGYLREWIWWIGLSSMGFGEALNVTAYAFAPASLVTPLGALSVLVSAVLSSKFLNERLNILGKIGCFLCLLGSTIIVLHAPKQGEVSNMEELTIKIQNPVLLGYICFVVILSATLILYCGPRIGHTNLVVYILACSLIGSLNVMGCKGVGIAVKETLAGVNNEFKNWLTWFMIVMVLTCIVIQMNYLNKALDIFNTSMVTPIFYVSFTTCVLVASAILFDEWGHVGWKDVTGNLLGFMVVICGVFLLHAFKDVDQTFATWKAKFRRQDGGSRTAEQDLESDAVLLNADIHKNGILSQSMQKM